MDTSEDSRLFHVTAQLIFRTNKRLGHQSRDKELRHRGAVSPHPVYSRHDSSDALITISV